MVTGAAMTHVLLVVMAAAATSTSAAIVIAIIIPALVLHLCSFEIIDNKNIPMRALKIVEGGEEPF